MKKLTVLLIALLSLSFAVDYVGVNSGSKRGKFSKTSSPVFAEITATTVNTTGVISEKPLRFGSMTPTATVALTACTANYSMPCTINNVVYKILLRK